MLGTDVADQKSVMVANGTVSERHREDFVHNQRGLECLSQGDTACALKELKLASALAPNDPINYFQIALIHESLGNTNEEIENLKKAIEADPMNPVFHYKLATAFERIADHPRSVAERSQARHILDELPKVDNTKIVPRNAIQGRDYYDQFGNVYSLGPS